MLERLENNSSIQIVGHRGYKSSYPENTLLAFQKSLEMGVDVLEFDLRFSKDKVIMVIHDETLDRTTNGSGKVSDYTMAELQQLDAGGWFGKPFEGLKIPTFEELCQLLASYPDTLLNVEIKPSSHAKEIADLAICMLEKYGCLSRCIFTCFDAEIITYIYDTYELKTQGFPEELMSNFVTGKDGTYSKMWSIGISLKLLTPALVKEFQQMGLLVGCWSTDNEQQVYYALGCGVTLLTCNDPQAAMHVRQQMGGIR
ncbi:glycerophosphodiester phosphodiesterase family protein [Paenibacillus sp. FSL H7-0331]|uniref:glycerophosphodiester phosphodiesterase family protein n=1 Tax=Paenibacillus sp. FSL H7-0331 TaxID=1920421 RepID=UPI00096CD5F0|nr:glycerophosphodiester phosphodiesterase family protein [Paenibacillus sp. FSL H7-0331]OMF19366.1 glycerophosphodiester phosphodiesterase [Paenibacillus sp. FSL H7-0331]